MRLFDGKELILATHNKGKALEISALLKDYVKNFQTAAELNLPEPEETGATFTENAVLKALAAAKTSNGPALADDSGLAVTGLGGQPGIYSARWAGPDKDFTAAMQRVNDELGDNKDRTAAFICVLALAWPDGHTETFTGRVDGQMTWPPRGKKGFGYDPAFIPDGHNRTFGEMTPAEKQAISHRSRAFDKLVQALPSQKMT